MVDEKELKKNSEKEKNKKILIGIIIAVVLVIAILIIIFLPKKNNDYEIALLENIKTIYVSEKKEIKAEVKNQSDAILNYQSSDENIVKFDKNIMEGISVGKSTITITSDIKGVNPLVFEVEVIDGGGIIKEVNFPKGELVIGINKEFDLNNELIINPTNGRFNSKVFISSDPSVASINEVGLLKTKKTGMTNITVNINNYFNSTITVFVVNNDVDGEIITNTDKIIFKEDNLKINVGVSKKIEYDVYPNNSSMKYVTTSCNNSNIISLDSEGNIKGLKIGKATIIYKTIDNREYKLNIEVTDDIIEVDDIKVSQELSMNLGDSKELLVDVVPSTATNKELNVKVSDTKILDASMKDNHLVINSKSVGNTVITLTSHNGAETEIKVTINEKEVPIVTVSPTPSNEQDEISS